MARSRPSTAPPSTSARVRFSGWWASRGRESRWRRRPCSSSSAGLAASPRAASCSAVATQPKLLIADEPTTGLDVSTAARILDLLRDLGRQTGASIVLITHDLGVVAATCHRVAIMHAGQIVEIAPVRALFAHPAHPYTRALVRSIPRIDREGSMAP